MNHPFVYREEAEEELAEKLAQIESQYTEYCQSLIQQHLNENNELLQKFELEKKALIQDHMDEISRWQEKERAQWKGDQMNPVEKPSEEQAGICKTFAIEKEMLERNYRDHINRLNHEIEGLNALVLKAKSSNLIKKEKQSLVNRLSDHCTKGNEEPHLFSLQEESTEPEHQMMDNTNKHYNENVWHQSDSAPLHVQHRLVLSAVEVLKGEQSLKQAQEHVLMMLQEMVRLVASLRAQLHKETKAQETLVVHQKGYGEDQIHLSNQYKKREDECMLAKDKSKDLLEGESPVKNLESALQMLGREEEELEKQVAVLAGHIGLEYKLMRNKIQEQGGDCAPKNECHYLIANVKELVDDNPSLCQQLLSKDDILNLLLGHLGKAMSQCQQLEQLTAKQIQESTDQLEREKDYVKGRLFQLEDLVRRLEQETISNQDDRLDDGFFSI